MSAMDIFDLREKKKAAGLTNQEISALSGILSNTFESLVIDIRL